MSGTFPSAIAPISVDITSSQPTLVRTAESGKRQARNSGGHLWEISAEFPVMRRFEFEPINAFIMSQSGSSESFKYIPPNKAAPLGIATGSPVVSGSHASGVKIINTSGWTASQTGILKAGDIFTLLGHTKVYMLTVDADSDAAGLSSLIFEPKLILPLGGAETIKINDVEFTVYIEDVHKYKTSAPNLSSYKVKMVESL